MMLTSLVMIMSMTSMSTLYEVPPPLSLRLPTIMVTMATAGSLSASEYSAQPTTMAVIVQPTVLGEMIARGITGAAPVGARSVFLDGATHLATVSHVSTLNSTGREGCFTNYSLMHMDDERDIVLSDNYMYCSMFPVSSLFTSQVLFWNMASPTFAYLVVCIVHCSCVFQQLSLNWRILQPAWGMSVSRHYLCIQ